MRSVVDPVSEEEVVVVDDDDDKNVPLHVGRSVSYRIREKLIEGYENDEILNEELRKTDNVKNRNEKDMIVICVLMLIC